MKQIKLCGLAAISLILSGVIFEAVADDLDKGLRNCARLDDGVERLACFDALATRNAPTPKLVAPTSDVGKWQVSSEVPKIDDSTNVTKRLSALGTFTTRSGQQRRVTLLILCRENTTDLYFHFGGEFMSDALGAGTATYRLDKEPAKTIRLRESSNHQSLGLWGGGSSIPFIKQLLTADRLLVQAAPYNENNIIAEFIVSGLTNAIKPLREACNW